jgi:hypothetical protein
MAACITTFPPAGAGVNGGDTRRAGACTYVGKGNHVRV